MQIELEALDTDYKTLFSVQTAPILAAKTTNGLATDYTDTPTEIALTPTQINKIKDTKMFRVSFLITAKQGEKFVSVQQSDYVTIKIGGKINGGVLLDFSSSNK